MRKTLWPKKRVRVRRAAVAALLLLSSAALSPGHALPAKIAKPAEHAEKRRAKAPSARHPFDRHALTGVASRYSDRFHGRRTANGERYNRKAYTAAHRTLPFGTHVKVTNRRNKRSVIVRINDRGPHVRGRVIDLSDAAAREIGLHRVGLTYVSAVIVESPG